MPLVKRGIWLSWHVLSSKLQVMQLSPLYLFPFRVPASRRNQRLSLGCFGIFRSPAPLWKKLLEVQDNKGFKNPTHLLLRRKTGCFSKPVLLWDIYSPGHKQTFCQVKSGLIAWDHFLPTSQGQAIWLWVPLAHSNKSLRAPTKTFSYCWCRRGVRRNISPVSG